jgi:hypothetical protein
MNVKDAINAPVDLPAAIDRYQLALQYAGSQVNFAYGQGLYMSPSDMILDITRGVAGYNNKILTSDSISDLGHQPDVNLTTVPPDPHTTDDFAGKINPSHEATQDAGRTSAVAPTLANDDHEGEKVALVLLATATFAGLLFYFQGRI